MRRPFVPGPTSNDPSVVSQLPLSIGKGTQKAPTTRPRTVKAVITLSSRSKATSGVNGITRPHAVATTAPETTKEHESPRSRAQLTPIIDGKRPVYAPIDTSVKQERIGTRLTDSAWTRYHWRSKGPMDRPRMLPPCPEKVLPPSPAGVRHYYNLEPMATDTPQSKTNYTQRK